MYPNYNFQYNDNFNNNDHHYHHNTVTREISNGAEKKMQRAEKSESQVCKNSRQMQQ